MNVSKTHLYIDLISICLPTNLSLIGDNPIFLTQVLELLRSHGHVLQNSSIVRSSSQQQVFFTESPTKLVMNTNVEYSSMVSSNGHTHGDHRLSWLC